MVVNWNYTLFRVVQDMMSGAVKGWMTVSLKYEIYKSPTNFITSK